MEKGILYGVGVGTGDPELMTLKAVRILREVDVVALPVIKRENDPESSVAYKIAVQSVPELVSKEKVGLFLPMTKDAAVLQQAWKDAAEQLRKCLDAGKSIAFPVIGDPCIYSTFSYVEELLGKDGYITQYINGVPSFCAAAAALGISLTQGDEVLHIVPNAVEYLEAKATCDNGQYVLMKSGRYAGQIRERLSGADRELYMVEDCGFATERCYRGSEEIPDRGAYLSLMIAKEC